MRIGLESILGKQMVSSVPYVGVFASSARYGGGFPVLDAAEEGGVIFKEVNGLVEASLSSEEDLAEQLGLAATDAIPAAMALLGVPGALQVGRTLNTVTRDETPTAYEAILTGPRKD